MVFDKNANRKKINLRTINKLLFILIISAGVYYIAGINDITVKGFRLQELKKEVIKLKDSNSILEAEAMSLGSNGNLSERIKGLNMVAVGKVEYLSKTDSFVAMK
jgi:cell division protein FtsB